MKGKAEQKQGGHPLLIALIDVCVFIYFLRLSTARCTCTYRYFYAAAPSVKRLFAYASPFFSKCEARIINHVKVAMPSKKKTIKVVSLANKSVLYLILGISPTQKKVKDFFCNIVLPIAMFDRSIFL